MLFVFVVVGALVVVCVSVCVCVVVQQVTCVCTCVQVVAIVYDSVFPLMLCRRSPLWRIYWPAPLFPNRSTYQVLEQTHSQYTRSHLACVICWGRMCGACASEQCLHSHVVKVMAASGSLPKS